MIRTTVKISDVYITNTFHNGTTEELNVCQESLFKGNKDGIIMITSGDENTDRRIVSGIINGKITFDDLFTGRAHIHLDRQ